MFSKSERQLGRIWIELEGDTRSVIPQTPESFLYASVPNGPLLSKIHNAAFDGHLIGIDPDYRLHVSERLLEIHDGPILDFGIKKLNGEKIRVPHDDLKKPDRDRLARRFELFKSHAAWPPCARFSGTTATGRMWSRGHI